MALESSAILRAVLYHIMTADSLAEAEIAVKAMCMRDDVITVERQVEEYKKLKSKEDTKC